MNEPAFPCYRIEYGDDKKTPPQQGYWQEVTLRDYFAAKAMQALIDKDKGGAFIESTCIDAYQFADAMLKSRTEPKGEGVERGRSQAQGSGG